MASAALTVTQTQIVAAPPARVLAAFFEAEDLSVWWQAVRSVTMARPLAPYAVEWEATDFSDEVLGRLGGIFHGTVMDYRPNAAFFIADAYWQPPEGDPIGPMALEVQCRPRGNGRSTTVTVSQSAADAGPRWRRYFDLMNQGWERALLDMRDHLDREAERSIR
jgi:uncharacterized protein YndB with AHSA1/START domain